MGSVRSEDPKNLNRQQQTARGPASPSRPLKRACWHDITIGGARPEPAACRRMGPKLPHTLTSENNCLPAARCIQATPFGKIDEPAVCAIVRSCLDPNLDPKNQPGA